MLRISVMTKDDTSFASRLAEGEGWAHREADFQRLLNFEPEGCFIARKDGRPIGMVTTTSYEDYAFLGCLIVKREERRQGVGKALMEAAIKYLSGRGVRTIELDGVFPAVDLYRKLGFNDKCLCLLFRGKGQVRRAVTIPYKPQMAETIVRFDGEMTGLNREKVVRRFLEDFQDSVFVIGDNRISAYAVPKPRAGGFFTVGPFIARNKEVAEALLHAVMNKYQGKLLALGIPEGNRPGVDLLLRNGFVHLPPSLRMYLGERRDYHRHVYGIIAPEKG